MVAELLLSITILSVHLDHPNFHVRQAAKENLVKINNTMRITDLIVVPTPESLYLKGLIENEKFSMDYQEIIKLIDNSRYMPIQAIHNEDVLDKDLYNYAIQNETAFPGFSGAVKYYVFSLLRQGVSKCRVLSIIERASKYYEQPHLYDHD